MNLSKKSLLEPSYRFTAVLKAILVLASLFILWSVLALISSIYQPLSFRGVAALESRASTSLADSLFLEIIQSYFSIFSVSVLVIIFLAVILGFLWARQFSNGIFPFYENQRPFSVLIKRFFKFSSHKIIDLANFEVLKKFNDLGKQIYGPAVIQILNNASALISKGNDGFRMDTSKGITPVQISSNERLVKILPQLLKDFTINLLAPSSNDLFNSLQFQFTFQVDDLPEKLHHSELQFLASCGYDDWKEILEPIIRLEFNYLLTKKKNSGLEITSLKQPDLDADGENNQSGSQAHSFHGSTIPVVRSRITRNRKRGQYPLVASDLEFISEPESRLAAMEMLQPLINEFIENLERTTIQLFGFIPIKIIHYEIGK